MQIILSNYLLTDKCNTYNINSTANYYLGNSEISFNSNHLCYNYYIMKKITLSLAFCALILSSQAAQANIFGQIVGGTLAVAVGAPLGAVVGLPTGIVKGAVDGVTDPLIPAPNMLLKILAAPLSIPLGIVVGAVVGVGKGAAAGAKMGYNIVN